MLQSMGLLLVTFCLLAQSGILFAAPPQYDWEQESVQHGLVISLYPAAGKIPLNRFHNWIIRVQDTKGEPVYPAHLLISGSMPAHGHGLPSSPQVTRYLDAGRYLVEGVKFNMMGIWKLVVNIQTPALIDRAELEIKLEY